MKLSRLNPVLWFRNRRIATKLLLAMAVMLTLLASVGVQSYLAMSHFQTQLNDLAQTTAGGQSIARLRSMNLQAERLQKNYLLAATDPERKKILPHLQEKVLDVDSASRAFIRTTSSPEQKAKFKKEIMPLIEAWSTLNDQIVQLVAQNKVPEALATSNTRGRQIMATLVDVRLDQLLTLSEQESRGQLIAARREFEANVVQLLINIGIALVIALAIAVFLSRQIAHPIRQVVDRLRDIAEGQGDLSRTLDVQRRDEIGELALWFNHFLVQLRSMVAQIDSVSSSLLSSSQALAQSANETGRSSQQVSLTIEQLAVGVTEQVKAITKSSDEVLRVSRATEQVSVNTQIAAESSQQAASAAANGGQVLQEALSHMEGVQGVFTDSTGVIERLRALSQEIQAIVSLIGGFAKKTNLLALNAGIEAARVGNQGLAFSVLAQEIRKLAVESSNATQHISDLVGNIQDETRRAVSIMHEGRQGVSQGTTIIYAASDAFARVVTAIEQTDREIQQIRMATEQLAASSEVMVQEMEAIANISEQSAAGAQQVAATTYLQTDNVDQVAASVQGLTKLSSELRGLVTRFTL